jgi:hypothetical protein
MVDYKWMGPGRIGKTKGSYFALIDPLLVSLIVSVVGALLVVVCHSLHDRLDSTNTEVEWLESATIAFVSRNRRKALTHPRVPRPCFGYATYSGSSVVPHLCR